MTLKTRRLFGLIACVGVAMIILGSAASVAEPECRCRSPEQYYLVGACACLQRPGGAQEIACCGKVLNNPSWRFTGKGCPIARSEPATPKYMSTVSADSVDVAPKTAFTWHRAFMPQ